MSFTPNPNFDRETSNPKDWAYQLGLLPQNHHIVFTKAELVNFLKQLNVHVGPNFTELSRLPKYATVGKLTQDGAAASQPAASAAPVTQDSSGASASSAAESEPAAQVVYTSSGDVFRPTRKVRELPGGGSAQITSLFGSAADEDERPIKPASRAAQAQVDVREEAENIPPSRPARATNPSAFATATELEPTGANPVGKYEGVPNDANMNNGFRPTRRVRVPGGTGGASSICFD